MASQILLLSNELSVLVVCLCAWCGRLLVKHVIGHKVRSTMKDKHVFSSYEISAAPPI
jgi:hypothetical protein